MTSFDKRAPIGEGGSARERGMTVSTTISDTLVAPAKVSAAAGAAFFAICAATYTINAADRMIFPIVLRPLSSEYGFSLAQGGFLATIYLMGLGIGGIITGYMLDRMTRKSSMVLGIIVYSIFTLLLRRHSASSIWRSFAL